MNHSSSSSHSSDEAERGEENFGVKNARGHRHKMDRVTFRIPKEKLEAIDALVEEDVYSTTSEALRDAVNELLLIEHGE